MSTEDEIQILYYSHLGEVLGCYPMIAVATATDEQRDEAWKRAEAQIRDQGTGAHPAVALYNELLMAVERKHEGETRHQTALRYIREAEEHNSGPGMDAHPKNP